eukprot:5580673-Amphidinium_carterae.2
MLGFNPEMNGHSKHMPYNKLDIVGKQRLGLQDLQYLGELLPKHLYLLEFLLAWQLVALDGAAIFTLPTVLKGGWAKSVDISMSARMQSNHTILPRKLRKTRVLKTVSY